jgi:hypothetical protein
VVATGRDPESVGEPVLVVGRVAEALGDVDIDPAEGVDDSDEPTEVDRGVMVDPQAEERARAPIRTS